MNKGVVVGCCQMWILLLEELLHQLLGSLSHYLQCFIHARWCRISVFNGTNEHVGSFFRLKDWVQKHHCKHVTQLIIWNTFVSHYWGEWSNLLNLMDLLHPGWLNHHLDVFGSVCRKIFPQLQARNFETKPQSLKCSKLGFVCGLFLFTDSGLKIQEITILEGLW